MESLRIKAEKLRSLSYDNVLAEYMGIGTMTENPIRVFFIQNLTDAVLMFSFDGIDDTFPLAPHSYFLTDVTANKASGEGFFTKVGQRFYVKQFGDVPTQGSVYVSCFYAEP